MLAAAIGIDRAVEGNIGRLVAGDDRLRRLDEHRGLERRQLLQRLPAVVEQRPRLPLIAARLVIARAASAHLRRQRAVAPGAEQGRIESNRLPPVDKRDHYNILTE
jgi:hypothetical protein